MTVRQITSTQAYSLLISQKNSFLIDVRTTEEFDLVGIVESSSFDNRMILIPWQFYRSGQYNPDFLKTLQNKLTEFTPNSNLEIIKQYLLIFICRSSVRSAYACNYINNFGFTNCYNISDGFEGAINENHHRSKINGWKASNLPWRQT
jgi:rhodanese-related sulfurtransferase